MKQSRRGFTLTELAIVIVIISILATIVLMSYNNAQGRARDARRKTDVLNIAKALEQYYNINGSYPIPTNTSGSLITVGTINQYWFVSGNTSWNNFATLLTGFIDKMPTEPRGNTIAASNGGYAYAYFAGDYNAPDHYCSTAAGQFYLIMYRTEYYANETYSDGPCYYDNSTSPPILAVGWDNVNTSYSFYRIIH